MKSRVLTI